MSCHALRHLMEHHVRVFEENKQLANSLPNLLSWGGGDKVDSPVRNKVANLCTEVNWGKCFISYKQ